MAEKKEIDTKNRTSNKTAGNKSKTVKKVSNSKTSSSKKVSNKSIEKKKDTSVKKDSVIKENDINKKINEKQCNYAKGLILILFSIFILLIVMIGATVAYFTAQATSDRGVDAEAAVIEINYIDSKNISVTDLIPAAESVAKAGYKKEVNQCLDDYGRVICGIYKFSIENNGEYSIDVTGLITVDVNAGGKNNKGFSNLSYIIYDVTDSSNKKIVKDTSVFSNIVGSTSSIFGDSLDSTFTFAKKSKRNYEMLIWLNEAGEANNVEQNARFKASVNIELANINE